MADRTSLPAPIAARSLSALVGTTVGLSDWITVDQSLIDAFAETTGDRQFIHIDPVRAAAEGPFGGTVAHGFLTLSLLPQMAQTALPRLQGVRAAVNYGFDRMRFVAPVPAGARVRGQFNLARIEDRGPAAILTTWHVEVLIEGADRPALTADWLGLRHLDEAAP
ncbi:MAG: MaoC family dehydratase [Paracoccus sp. (in: a-proteobacteria)]|uniref:MaoC family dehydratase n=1 Tax=Paracoccus sp. TaxID=267 RepID=UPI003919988A